MGQHHETQGQASGQGKGGASVKHSIPACDTQQVPLLQPRQRTHTAGRGWWSDFKLAF